ncbi:hypothetical protein [Erwinia amylovora]|uniref:hypothetical protein n=1 Tax=Erwinia amylovora TaxID=552 RepID=UPI003EF3EDA1
MPQSAIFSSSKINPIYINNTSGSTATAYDGNVITRMKEVTNTGENLAAQRQSDHKSDAGSTYNGNITPFSEKNNDQVNTPGLVTGGEAIKYNHENKKDDLKNAEIGREIKKLCKQGKIGEAEKLVNAMSDPHVWVLTALMEGCFSKHKCGDAEQVFKSMEEKNLPVDLWVFKSLIKYYTRTVNAERAEWVMTKMQKAGIKPDEGILDKLLEVYRKAGNHAGEMHVSKQLHQLKCTPKLAAMHKEMNDHVETGDIKGAERVFFKINQYGLTSDQKSLDIMLKGYGYTGNIAEAKSIFEKPAINDITPYNRLMKVCAQAKAPEKAEQVLARIKGANLKPNVQSYGMLIKAYIVASDWPGAERAMKRAKEAECGPDSDVCQSLLKTCGATGQIDRAQWVLREASVEVRDPLFKVPRSELHNYLIYALDTWRKQNPAYSPAV